MEPHRALFITGVGTEIGKTYVTAALTRRMRGEARPVRTLKPVASGVVPLDDPAFAKNDAAVLLAAQGLPVTAETVAACSPWRFLAPLAPDQAAAREGRRLLLGELVAWCEARLAEAGRQTILIEGAGGLMSPITEDATNLDWLKALRLPALLVSGSYLGAISHTLTAVETLRAHAVPLVGVAISESEDAPTPPESVAEAIGRRIAAPIAVLHRGGDFPDALAGIV